MYNDKLKYLFTLNLHLKMSNQYLMTLTLIKKI